METTAYETLGVAREGGVLRIELDREQSLNAVNPQMGLDLVDALADAAGDGDVRTVLLCAKGAAFSVGADLKGGGVATTPDGHLDLGGLLRDRYNPIVLAMRALPKPIVAAVQGPAVGVGLSFALAADFLLAGDSAYFLLGFGGIGLAPDGGASIFLPARLGHARAHEMLLGGGRVDAKTALDWGLVNAVHADDELAGAAIELAARLAFGAPRSYASSKELLNRALYPDLEGQLEREAQLQGEHARTADFLEGVRAFLQGDTPSFTGN